MKTEQPDGYRYLLPRMVAVLGVVSLLALVALATVANAGRPAPMDAPEAAGLKRANWLARAGADVAGHDVRSALRESGVSSYRYYPDLDVWALTLLDSTQQSVRSSLLLSGLFEWLVPNRTVVAAQVPDDPYFASNQWNMTQVKAPAAWDVTTGSDQVVVAILDTGIDLDHPDLASKVWVNKDEIAYNGLDDDANGFIDDRWGWNFYSETPNSDDDNGHGSHVAGIAGAATNNGMGVAGMAWETPLMAVKFLDRTGTGDFLGMLQAMKYAVDNGARILNLSVTVDDDMTPEEAALLDERMAYVTAHGGLVVGASGNQGHNTVSYPAAHPDVLAVGATTRMDVRWYASNYGDGLDLVAPGYGVYSTSRWSSGSGYRYASGTSMAAPHVSGAAALIWSVAPGRPVTDVAQILRATCDDINGAQYPGPDIWVGWGRLNVRRAVRAALDGQILRLQSERSSFQVLEDSMTVTATVTTELGQPVADGTVVTFSTDIGSVLPSSATTVGGVATTEFDGGTTVGTATLHADTGVVTETLWIAILPAPPQSGTLTAEPEDVVVGGASAVVTLEAMDGAGNPVADATLVVFSVTDGTILPQVCYTLDGQANATYSSPDAAGPIVVSAKVAKTLLITHTLNILPGEPVDLTLDAGADWLWAGDVSVPITATATDQFGNPVADGYSVAFQATAGEIAPASGPTVAGVVAATLTGILGRGQVCIDAELDDLSDSLCLAIFEPAVFLPRLHPWIQQ